MPPLRRRIIWRPPSRARQMTAHSFKACRSMTVLPRPANNISAHCTGLALSVMDRAPHAIRLRKWLDSVRGEGSDRGISSFPPRHPFEVAALKRRAFLSAAVVGIMVIVPLLAAQKRKPDGLLLLDWAAKGKHPTPPVSVLIELGKKDTEPTDWTGRARVSGAK